jgi:hypothetical protein
MTEGLEVVPAVPVETVQGSAPEESSPVLDHAGNAVLREPVCDRESIETDRSLLGVKIRCNKKGKEKHVLKGRAATLPHSPEKVCNHR